MTKSRGILAPRRNWTRAELVRLIEAYPTEKAETIAAVLKRPLTSIYHKAASLGLSKSPAFLNGPHSGRLTPENCARGIPHRFTQGQTSWLKGRKKTWPGGEATQFKKGSRPHNWVPIGTERISSDGIRQRKVTDTGYPPRDWQSVHTLLWIEANGPIPAGHIVVFRDKDRGHLELTNLELVTRKEQMRRNSIHRYPAQLREVIRLSGVLNRTIKRLDNEEQTV